MKVAQAGNSITPKILGNGRRETGRLYQLISHYGHNGVSYFIHSGRVRCLQRVF